MVAVGTSLGLLAGCTDAAPEPRPTATPESPRAAVVSHSPTPSPSEPSATPSPSPTVIDVTVPPERPAVMDEKSEEGVRAAAQYFLLQYPYMIATGDTADWERASWPECGFCASALKEARAIHSKGQHGEGGAFALGVTGALPYPGSNERYAVAIDFSQAASTTVDADGAVVEEFDGPKMLRADFVFVWDANSWQVEGMDVS